MLKIKKQITTLYLNSALSAFGIASASWVALLAARGLSLVEIGLAESVFHLTSLIFEVPSGVIADVFGRRRTMVLSRCMAVLSSAAMMCSRSMGGILVAMALSALSYNLASGTREALAYDSLRAVGREGEYDSYASTEMMIYRVSGSAATLCAGLALALGYRRAYLLDLLLGMVCLCVTLGLKEAPMDKPLTQDRVVRQMAGCFRESLSFLRGNGPALKLIFLNSAVGAVATLLGFFLQALLPECGLPGAALGPVLFLMGLGGALGAKGVLLLRRWSYGRVALLAGTGVAICLAASFTRMPAVLCLCGFCAALFDDLLQVRSDVRLNDMIPSEQRATLISISSLCFSLVMVGLSPALGALFSV